MSRLYRQLDALQLLIFNLIRAQAQRRNVNYDRLANVNGVRLHYSPQGQDGFAQKQSQCGDRG